MFSAFRKGVEVYGLPKKVRSDRGGENVEIWRYLLEQHNNNPSHVIVGSFTHMSVQNVCGEMSIDVF